MESLHEQCPNTGNNHGDSTVDVPNRRVWAKVPDIIAVGDAGDPVGFSVGVPGEHHEELGAVATAD
jgi:hypothetical protein